MLLQISTLFSCFFFQGSGFSPFGSRENLVSSSPRHSWTSSISAALFPTASAPPTTTTATSQQQQQDASPSATPDKQQQDENQNKGQIPKRSSQVELGGGRLVHDSLSSPGALSANSADSATAGAGAGASAGAEEAEQQQTMMTKALIAQKKAQLINRISSLDSNASFPGCDVAGGGGGDSDTASLAPSETGSFVTNPAFRNSAGDGGNSNNNNNNSGNVGVGVGVSRGRLKPTSSLRRRKDLMPESVDRRPFNDNRSVVSDSELDQVQFSAL